jgi:two-component system, response regulator YesN
MNARAPSIPRFGRGISAFHARATKRSFFLRLIVSYIGLVSVVSVVLAFAAWFFFQAKYNGELERLHMVSLSTMERELRAEFSDSSKTIYMQCVTQLLSASEGFLGPEDKAAGNSAKINLTYQNLSSLVSRYYETVAAIHLYYREAGLIVSSSSGLLFQNDRPERSQGRDWLRLLAEKGTRGLWTKAPGGNPIALRCFPILSDAETCSVLIAVEFRAEAIRNVVSGPLAIEGGSTWVADGAGGPVAVSPAGGWSDSVASVAGEAAARMRKGTTGYVRSMGGNSCLVSAVAVSDTGWTLVNVTPLSVLYRKGDSIRFVLLSICLGTIALGIVIVFFLAPRMYGPLGSLIGRVRGMFGLKLPPPADATNEYSLLNYALDGLSDRMNELSATLQRNLPVIKHEFVQRLLNGDGIDGKDLSDSLGVVGHATFPERSAAAIVVIEEKSESFDVRAVKYRLAERMEGESGRFVLASILPGAAVALIVGADDGREGLASVAAGWGDLARNGLDRRIAVYLGPSVDSPFDLQTSFAEARLLAAYGFFFPEEAVLIDRADLLAREGRDSTLARTTLDLLSESLVARNTPGIDSALQALRNFVRSNAASADAARRELSRVLGAIADYAESAFPGGGAPTRGDILSILDTSRDIDDFIDRAARVAKDMFVKVDIRSDERNAILVARIKTYVKENLAAELSLQKLSEVVGISTGYMSKVFRDETGGHFVEFVTDSRLAEAQRLLTSSDSSVQEISRAVGFNTPAYFIKQFRLKYGCTPYEYRRTH